MRGVVTCAALLLVAGCDSSGAGSDPSPTSLDPGRYAHATAQRIADDIDGCDAKVATPANDLERSVTSLAECSVDGSTVRILARPSDQSSFASIKPGSGIYFVGGYDWGVLVQGDRSVAQHIADELGAEFGP